MTLPITTIFASAVAIWLIVLSMNVVRRRGAAKVSLGDGGDKLMLRKIRAQANLAEYAPIMVLLTGLAEYQGANFYFLAVTAAVFFSARLGHGYALSFSENSPKGRFYGTLFTFIPLAIVAIHNLLLVSGLFG